MDETNEQGEVSVDDVVIEDEKVIPLRKPVEVGKVRYESLSLVEPTSGQIETAYRVGAGNSMTVTLSLISQVAKVPLAVARALSQRDFQETADFLGSFSTSGQQTAEI